MQKKTESIVHAHLPTQFGTFTVYSHQQSNESLPTLVMLKPWEEQVPLVRIHSECLTGDALGSMRCDCGFQLQESLRLIQEEGGLLIYLRQEGRGIGLHEKIQAYRLQDQGLDTVEANLRLGHPADQRNYKEAAQILRHYGIHKARLLTNNPEKLSQLEQEGIQITERIPLVKAMDEFNEKYLQTKKEKFGHYYD
ncbi:MAG TPA: GTP cyclohydrolase II [Saprospiraceae bacterium]|nr:GTP cyclohydrolase II [Saprospiraceae bacterium]